MNGEQDKKASADSCGITDDCPVCAMIKDFYRSSPLSLVIAVWVWIIIFTAGAIYSGVEFFKVEQAREQILYAAIFICCFNGIAVIKMFAWQMIHRRSIERQIKGLEQRIAELSESVKNK
jgi:uncharacterized membrane protein YbjE (DUF340 family)